jgi:hypothetical protein
MNSEEGAVEQEWQIQPDDLVLGDRVFGAGDIDHAHAGSWSINTRADRFAAMAKASVRESGTRVTHVSVRRSE